ncbi:DAD1-like seeding establishment-related lipase [Hibiscus trionum]|uniref:Phospholipase A1 n=1 Tax=Hibiscus trionum TaxID=183268 RepID=A0A9W7LVG2_HIBTR|nr:DAD1-like seeding establishment-related lipase [Hibiscus trionum]GMI78033.1 DAD1-like seeding establishment-related lipase [Hibiscus trionum]GMI78035.1 DAD1-like seeding establishment-related lipase [Hibiscus trionum]
MGSIATRWRKLSGESNWQGLLHPLDLDLRRYIIHYAQRVGAVGDLYDNKTKKPSASKQDFFEKACLIKGNEFKYVVTHFLYAESAWFGYVAVAPDDGKAVLGRRDILVAWRGTKTDSEWIMNANATPKRATELFGPTTEAMVHSGFLSLYTNARKQVLDAVSELVNKYQNEEISITVTGYSLGAALATLTAMDIVANKRNKSFMVTAFVYGGPRVGTTGLKKEFKNLGVGGRLHLLRIQNYSDTVPQVPTNTIYDYTHVGEVLIVDTGKSEYLKSKDSASAHELNVYLHGIAGVQETGFELEDAVYHDIALVNKYLDCLKDPNIPPNWWDVDENRRKMVQKDDGYWEKK